MTLGPVIIRELRAHARHDLTYWLRLSGAGALLVLMFFAIPETALGHSEGRRLFQILSGALFVAIWTLVPLMTADCISRERREGTLGLLFLTPLKSLDIVLAKSVVHGLRAATIGLAAVPAMALPFLIGGVSWQEAVTVFLILLGSTTLALGAGLIASSWATGATRSLVLAGLLGGIGLASFVFAGGVAVYETHFGFGTRMPAANRWFATADLSFWEVWSRKAVLGWFLFIDPSWVWRGAGLGVTTANLRLLAAMSGLALVSLVCLLTLVTLAARNVHRHWREEPPSARQRWLEKRFCTPVVAVSYFRRWMRGQLEKNPVGWLEQRRWSGRVLSWIWFGVACSLIITLILHPIFFRGGDDGDLSFLAWVMAACLAITSAGSFKRERETRVLELLLVAPLSTRRIMLGRLFGLWQQFLLTALLIVGIWLFFQSESFRVFHRNWQSPSAPPFILFFVCSYATVPVIGLYFSLRCPNFVVALAATVGLAIAFPFGAAAALVDAMETWGGRGAWPQLSPENVLWLRSLAMPLQIIPAAMLARRLYRDLEQRRFALRMVT